MTYLLNSVNTYRVPDEQAALALRDELQNISGVELISFSYTNKEIKAKGEVIETYTVVKAKLEITKEKDPETTMNVTYAEVF